MSRVDAQQPLLPSVLDRLLDVATDKVRERRLYTVEQMVTAVHRDLEDLLNTRQSHVGMPEEYVEAHNSVAGYGLPDLATLNAITNEQRETIGRILEAVITRFEPRLRDVRATLLPEAHGADNTLRFRVDARLSLDPAPEVAFDTILELATGHYLVRPSGG
jgi:type VI secretion system protein ImpF